MDEDKIIEVIQSAMSRFVDGSSSGASGIWWSIHDSLDDNRGVAWFGNREQRDLRLRWKNARAAWDAAKAELAETGYVIIGPVERSTGAAPVIGAGNP